MCQYVPCSNCSSVITHDFFKSWKSTGSKEYRGPNNFSIFNLILPSTEFSSHFSSCSPPHPNLFFFSLTFCSLLILVFPLCLLAGDLGDPFTYNTIEVPTVVGLLRNILTQYPDNGQIIKVCVCTFLLLFIIGTITLLQSSENLKGLTRG